ncbi:hypothetical protein N2152v2_002091 [Parachlorella kessleri]
MAKLLSCLIDDTVQQYCQTCTASRKQVEDGSPAISIQHAANSGGSNSKKQGKGGKAPAASSGLVIDKEWVIEHAAQVLAMLPGGMAVVGIYVLCPEGSFAAATGQLVSLLSGLHQELRDKEQGMLLLHVDAVTGKLAAREFTAGSAGSLRPCELKTASLLPNMVAVQCRLEVSIDIYLTNPRQRLRDALAAAVEWEIQHRMQPAVGLLAAQLWPTDAALVDIPKTGSSGSKSAEAVSRGGGEHIQADLLLPPAGSSPALLLHGGLEGALQRGRGQHEALGSLQLSGMLDCRAYLPKRETAAAAVEALKQDTRRTLQARAAMLADLAEQQQEEAAQAAAAAGPPQHGQQAGGTGSSTAATPPLLQRLGEVSAPMQLALPRRVWVAGPAGAFCFCDYLLEGEAEANLLSRAAELGLNLAGVDMDAVQCLEAQQQQQHEQAAAGKTGAQGAPMVRSLAELPALRIPPARQGSVDLSQYTASQSPATLLGKRDAEGVSKRPPITNRTPSRYRGVTHHCRTSRYEAHVWRDSKQCYLGGYYVEEQAALAYDLAAIKFRGVEATTNFDTDTFVGELEVVDLVSTEDVVQCLRNQSKGMNRLDTGTTGVIHMDDWELAISECIQQDKWQHVGVFATEVEAARAYDRALILRGVNERTSTNFPFDQYPDMAVPVVAPSAPSLALASSPVESSSNTGQTVGQSTTPVYRTTSITPRSVFEFAAAAAFHPTAQLQPEAGAEKPTCEDPRPTKQPRAEGMPSSLVPQDIADWVEQVIL